MDAETLNVIKFITGLCLCLGLFISYINRENIILDFEVLFNLMFKKRTRDESLRMNWLLFNIYVSSFVWLLGIVTFNVIAVITVKSKIISGYTLLP